MLNFILIGVVGIVASSWAVVHSRSSNLRVIKRAVIGALIGLSFSASAEAAIRFDSTFRGVHYTNTFHTGVPALDAKFCARGKNGIGGSCASAPDLHAGPGTVLWAILPTGGPAPLAKFTAYTVDGIRAQGDERKQCTALAKSYPTTDARMACLDVR